MESKFPFVGSEQFEQEDADNVLYRPIMVRPRQASRLMFTMDDNTSGNTWKYHIGGNKPHITEIFNLQRVGTKGPEYQIMAVALPGHPNPILSIREDPAGVPEQFPVFRTISQITAIKEDVNDVILHTYFTREDSSGLTAFSYKTTNMPTTFYLVPSSDERYHIESKATTTPEYVFRIGRPVSNFDIEMEGQSID